MTFRMEGGEEEFDQKVLALGMKHLWCKEHNRPLMDALTNGSLRFRYPQCTKYVCDAWNELPQINGCIFVEKGSKNVSRRSSRI